MDSMEVSKKGRKVIQEYDSVVSSDARLHVNPLHFLARSAVY